MSRSCPPSTASLCDLPGDLDPRDGGNSVFGSEQGKSTYCPSVYLHPSSQEFSCAFSFLRDTNSMKGPRAFVYGPPASREPNGMPRAPPPLDMPGLGRFRRLALSPPHVAES